MNFDLTGLFQRQSQMVGTEQTIAGSQSAVQADRVNVNLNLSVGQIVSGQVVSVEGDLVSVEISPGSILQAKVEDGLALLKGMTVSFEVSSMSDKQIALRTLFQNTANIATINKALEQAELLVTAETTSMVNAMMREGMPIDKASLQTMFRQITTYPQVSSEEIVTMSRLEIPITDANVKQFSDYMNMQHQIRASVETIADSFADSMTSDLMQLMAEGNTSETANRIMQFMEIFTQMTNGSDEAQQINVIGNEQVAMQDSMLSKNAMTATLDEMMRAVVETAEDPELNSETNPVAQGVEAKVQAWKSDMENLGLPSEKAEQFLRGQMSGKELVTYTNQLFSAIAEKGTGENEVQLARLAELMQRPEIRMAIKSQILDQWMLSPQEVSDKQKVSDFYAKLSEQSGKLMDALKSIPGANQNLLNQVTNVHQNIEFMNQLNQTMSYIQFPLKLSGESAHGDLYVYTNKKSLAEDDGNVSAFLHLDMDHLGPVDVYVAMQHQKVSTQFYLKDDEMLDFIQQHIHLLNDRLTQKGYQMNAQFSVKEKPGNVMKEIVEDHRENMRISTYSFDMRA